MDADGDGRISRDEWRGSVQSFRVHDWNRDGLISGNELRDAVRQAQAGELEDYDAVDSMNDWSASRFTALDRNRDGRIARAEWQDDLDSFYRVDRDRNNVRQPGRVPRRRLRRRPRQSFRLSRRRREQPGDPAGMARQRRRLHVARPEP